MTWLASSQAQKPRLRVGSPATTRSRRPILSARLPWLGLYGRILGIELAVKSQVPEGLNAFPVLVLSHLSNSPVHFTGRYCLGVGKPAPINCSLLRVGAALGAGEKRYPPSSDQHCNRLQKPNPGRASGPFCGWDAALTPDNGASQQPLSDGFQRPNALDLGSDCRIDVLSIPVSLQT